MTAIPPADHLHRNGQTPHDQDAADDSARRASSNDRVDANAENGKKERSPGSGADDLKRGRILLPPHGV